MGFSCGIVGLPNVGKSTLFNALTSAAQAEAANYPFCTIEPNVGRVGVPDARLDQLAALAQSKEVIPTHLEFVDIAGLVRGASKGEGLGNQFLAHIREVDAIVQVLRCFEDGNITHVENRVDPIDDFEIILSELMIADMESLEKQKDKLIKKVRGQDKEAKALLDVVEKLLAVLDQGKPANKCDLGKEELELARTLNMLTIKPMMIVCNVEEDAAADGNEFSAKVQAWANENAMPSVVISAKIEEEIAQLETDEEKKDFLETLGLEQTGLARIIQAGYKLLDLMTFFTVGPKEARAWTITRNTSAPKAAGRIHTDFEKGFIRAETIAFDDYVSLKGEQGAKEAGKMRLEGKEYIAKDGDIFHFRFNV